MTWFRVGGGSGIPAALKNRMNAVLNKKFGTAVDYPPNGWPDDVNLMGPLPEGTASGNPAIMTDGADQVPTKNVVVNLPASLTGVSSVTETQTGRNLASGGVYEYNARNMIISPVFLKAGTYTVSFNRGVNVQYIYIRKGDTVNLVGEAYATKSNTTFFTFVADEDEYYYAQLYRTNTSDTWEDYPVTEPQIELGSTAHAYESYTAPTIYSAALGRTIHGGTADLVTGEGTETYAIIDLGNCNWVKVTSNVEAPYFSTTAAISPLYNYQNGNPNVISNNYNYAPIGSTGTADGFYIIASSYVRIRDANYSNMTAQEFKTAIAGTYLVYEQVTPTDFTFTGQEVPTRLGYNAFWSDSGDTEVTYRRDIDLALQAVSNNRGLMMASRPAIEPASIDQGSEESTENNIETEGEQDAR